jgi:hypothetical protein
VDDPLCVTRPQPYRNVASAEHLHVLAREMMMLADTSFYVVAQSKTAAQGQYKGGASEFYYSAAITAAAAVEIDPTESGYRLLLGRLLWRVAQLGDGKLNFRLTQRAEVQASCAALLAKRAGDVIGENDAKAFSIELRSYLPERSQLQPD